jgi:hypothetical protein
MTRAANFTEAEMRRAIKAARAIDPAAVVEFIAGQTSVRILPPSAKKESDVDKWFNTHDND